MHTRVARLDAPHRRDFYDLHCQQNEAGWCCCVAWWVPTWDGWGERTAEENRTLRDELFDRGELDIYLIYEGERPVGSCQAGPRDRLSKLVSRFGLVPDPSCFAITCFFIAPDRRRSGIASRLLDAVLEDLESRGVQRVECYPKRGPDLDAGDLWTGPEAMFTRAGFTVIRDDPKRPVLARSLT